MAQDLAPVPQNTPMLDEMGLPVQAWSDWFRNLIPSSSKGVSGYTKLPGGLVVQWGITGSLSSATTTSTSFPLEFPTNCLQVWLGVRNNSAVATAATGTWGTGGYSATAFDLYNRASVALAFNWVAIGY